MERDVERELVSTGTTWYALLTLNSTKGTCSKTTDDTRARKEQQQRSSTARAGGSVRKAAMPRARVTLERPPSHMKHIDTMLAILQQASGGRCAPRMCDTRCAIDISHQRVPKRRAKKEERSSSATRTKDRK